MRRKWIFIVPTALLGIVLFTFIGGEIVRLLWNWLLPPLLDLPQITFWQALGSLALCRILFGGFGISSSRRRNFRGLAERMPDQMADRVADLWDRMTPEERERFRQRVRARCGFDPV